MRTSVQTARSLPHKIVQFLSGAAIGMALAASPTRAAITDMFDLTDATGQIGDIVEVNLMLKQAFGDFEGLDFFAPDFSLDALELVQAPSLGPALPPSWVFAPPTLAIPKLGVSNTQPGVESLPSGVLAVYRFRILDTAPLGATTVTIPFQVDEVDVDPLSAEVTVIPEPASYVLFGAGLALVAWVRRRRLAQA